MTNLTTLKKEVEMLHKALIVPAEDNTVLMSINDKDYTLKNLHEGIQKLIEISRTTPCQQ